VNNFRNGGVFGIVFYVALLNLLISVVTLVALIDYD